MNAARGAQCRIVSLMIGGLLVLQAVPALAESVGGRVAAARVQEESYRHILDDMLYTHAGDDRSIIGPEHDPAEANIAMLLQSYGLTVTLDPFVYSWPEPNSIYYNVVGTKLGTTYPDQEYIVGAHYDSGFVLSEHGKAPHIVDSYGVYQGVPGADDNGSGTALVLEAARVLSQYESDYTIRFIAFDLEEQGMSGSEAYVEEHIDDDIVAMVNADMVAYNPGADIVSIYSGSAPLKNSLAEAGNAYALLLTWAIYDQYPGGDHRSFEDAGFEACMVIEDFEFQPSNPYYHTLQDSVDTPDYIDYVYATQVTRGIVGYLVDHAGVRVDIPDADYDADGDVDEDDFDVFASCFTGPGIPPTNPDCNFFDFESDGDVDCADWDLFAAVWPGPGFPPVFRECVPVLLRPAAQVEGGRYLVVNPPEHGWPIGLLVTGDPDDAAVSCVSRYVQANGSLDTTPVFQTFDAWGTVYVGDEEVVPGTTYHVQCDYGELGSPLLSSAVSATTGIWGDTVGEYTESGWTPPDGTIGIMDIVAIVDKFRDLPTAPPIYWVDLIGLGQSGVECAPDQRIDIIDAVGAVDAFRGQTYWESMMCPQPCPE